MPITRIQKRITFRDLSLNLEFHCVITPKELQNQLIRSWFKIGYGQGCRLGYETVILYRIQPFNITASRRGLRFSANSTRDQNADFLAKTKEAMPIERNPGRFRSARRCSRW